MRKLPNWIQAYLAYAAESESPEAYHLWTAIGTVSAALRRQVYFRMGYFTIFPNNYIVLIGPAGVAKSTAMNMGKRLIRHVPTAKLSVDSTSRERLILDMSQASADGTSAMAGFSSELGSLFTTSQMDMVVFLIEVYDAGDDFEHRSKSGGINKIKNPCFNLIACTTPDWFATGLPLQTAGIGFLSRLLFIYGDTARSSSPFPELSPEQEKLYELLIADLQEIATLSGEFKLTPDAKEFYVDWYKNKRLSEIPHDTRLQGYYARKRIHVLKTAMVVAATQRNDLLLTQQDIADSFSLLSGIEKDLPKVFQSTGKNPLALDIQHVLQVVISNKAGISEDALLDLFKHNVRESELREVLSTLVRIHAIRVEYDSRGSASYRPL